MAQVLIPGRSDGRICLGTGYLGEAFSAIVLIWTACAATSPVVMEVLENIHLSDNRPNSIVGFVKATLMLAIGGDLAKMPLGVCYAR